MNDVDSLFSVYSENINGHTRNILLRICFTVINPLKEVNLLSLTKVPSVLCMVLGQ